MPIESQPYKIEYVKVRPRTPDDSAPAPRAPAPPPGRPTYDLLKAFGSNTPKEKAKQSENVETFGNEDDDQPEEPASEPKSASPQRRGNISPSRLQTVQEEFEWDDEVF